MSQTSLLNQRCLPCEGGVDPIPADAAGRLMSQLHGDWSLAEDARAISRDYQFKDFHQTMAFVNALAWVAHREDHHPDLEVGYRHCRVRYSTHAIGGLSQNDFICAAKIDELVA